MTEKDKNLLKEEKQLQEEFESQLSETDAEALDLNSGSWSKKYTADEVMAEIDKIFGSSGDQ
jgi:hypothetical protein